MSQNALDLHRPINNDYLNSRGGYPASRIKKPSSRTTKGGRFSVKKQIRRYGTGKGKNVTLEGGEGSTPEACGPETVSQEVRVPDTKH